MNYSRYQETVLSKSITAGAGLDVVKPEPEWW